MYINCWNILLTYSLLRIDNLGSCRKGGDRSPRDYWLVSDVWSGSYWTCEEYVNKHTSTGPLSPTSRASAMTTDVVRVKGRKQECNT